MQRRNFYFCYIDLMKLKRVQSKQSHGRTKKTEALISKHAGGLCFDFNYKDTNLYVLQAVLIILF